MKLRSTEPYWLIKNGLIHSYSSLKENINCDILVIGAGITGALISHSLHNAGFNTVLIDKRDVATGSTSATTALLQYEIDAPLMQLTDLIGEEAAVKCYKKGIEAILKLKKLVKDENITCGFEMKESLQISHSENYTPKLKKEFLLRQKHGFDVTWLNSKEIEKRFNMKSQPGILSKTSASVDAFRLTHGLIQKNYQNGMRVYDSSPIDHIIYEDNPLVKTVEGWYITCKKIVFCTGYETMKMFQKKYADIISTFACISEQDFNLHSTLKNVMIWDTANPYVYMRTTDDGRFLVGGEDIRFKFRGYPDKFIKQQTEKIIEKLNKLFPTLEYTMDYNWSGAFATTKDALPYIGIHPQFKNSIFVLGLGGNGITFSIQGMELVLKILANERDDLLNYYRFDR